MQELTSQIVSTCTRSCASASEHLGLDSSLGEMTFPAAAGVKKTKVFSFSEAFSKKVSEFLSNLKVWKTPTPLRTDLKSRKWFWLYLVRSNPHPYEHSYECSVYENSGVGGAELVWVPHTSACGTLRRVYIGSRQICVLGDLIQGHLMWHHYLCHIPWVFKLGLTDGPKLGVEHWW